jgi:atlastin
MRHTTLDWMGGRNEELTGFSWRCGSSADTKGILFWSDVFLHETPTEKLAIILMDTQGLFEPGSSQEENAKIFGLSTLLSSVQIVNLQGIMQENQIEYLEMATSLSKYVTRKCNNSVVALKIFQKLIFLIRDWSDQDFDLGYEGGNEYYKTCFSNTSRCNEKSRTIRMNISKSFEEIHCFLLNHPGLGVTTREFRGEWGTLVPSFVEKLKILIESILEPQYLTKKLILGKSVTGGEFREFVVAYLEAFQNSKLPDVENIYQATLRSQIKSIKQDQVNFYKENVEAFKIDYNDNSLESTMLQFHSRIKDKCLQQFSNADKFEDMESNIVTQYRDNLLNHIEEIFSNWFQKKMQEQKIFKQEKELEILKRSCKCCCLSIKYRPCLKCFF